MDEGGRGKGGERWKEREREGERGREGKKEKESFASGDTDYGHTSSCTHTETGWTLVMRVGG